MTTLSRTVELLRVEGTGQGQLTHGLQGAASASEFYWVRLTSDGEAFTGEGRDYFEALVALRRQLEVRGTLIRVNGAGRNVWPSGMCRSTGGIRAYRITLGVQPRMADLVHIFECSAGIEPATIAEQEHFRDRWFASFAAA